MCVCDAASAAAKDMSNNDQGDPEEQDARLGAMPLPVWPPAAEAEEEDLMIEETVGYLQISDEPSSQTNGEQEAALVASNGEAPAPNSGLVNPNNGQHASPMAGPMVTNGRHPQERVVMVNGMEFHVFGNVSGLELLGNNNSNHEEDTDSLDSEEEEEEEHRRAEVEKAIAEAHEADEARRAAPLPPDHCKRILNAMKGITLGDFRPSWADSVPEDQWMSKIKDSTNSAAK